MRADAVFFAVVDGAQIERGLHVAPGALDHDQLLVAERDVLNRDRVGSDQRSRNLPSRCASARSQSRNPLPRLRRAHDGVQVRGIDTGSRHESEALIAQEKLRSRITHQYRRTDVLGRVARLTRTSRGRISYRGSTRLVSVTTLFSSGRNSPQVIALALTMPHSSSPAGRAAAPNDFPASMRTSRSASRLVTP